MGLIASTMGQDVGTPCADEISAQCPAEDPDAPVYIPEPSDCRKFCECSGGDAYKHTCAPGLLFDAEALICQWPESMDCGNRPIGTDPPTEPPIVTTPMTTPMN
ncbi:unnamed protein product [Meganyctiphanes norvegica]|uniref:Chitin-binding type-2 domain-containing protein n=1 Tax=Meganyctiphanes norvegica TaxID=48144 RepID=A0AAV2R6R5_MEGNR